MSVSVSLMTLLNSDRKTESQPQTWLASLSGNFAEDKGIKVFFCAVFLLFLVHMRQLTGLGGIWSACQHHL